MTTVAIILAAVGVSGILWIGSTLDELLQLEQARDTERRDGERRMGIQR